MITWLSFLCGIPLYGNVLFWCGIFKQSYSVPFPHDNFPTAEFRNLSVTKCIMIQDDITLCCKNMGQTLAVLFAEVSFDYVYKYWNPVSKYRILWLCWYFGCWQFRIFLPLLLCFVLFMLNQVLSYVFWRQGHVLLWNDCWFYIN